MPLSTKDRIVSFFREYPKATDQEAINSLGLARSTYYRNKAVATDFLKKQNNSLIADQVQGFLLPPGVSRKVLPPEEYKWVHLATYLTKFRAGDRVPPYNKTKAEIMYSVSRDLKANPDKAFAMINGLQNLLALYAIYCGDPSMFSNSLGKLEVPESYEL